jgi:FemAB-related protein (PEP-CTERM system-associated)
LGTPVFSRRFFGLMMEYFGDDVDVLVVRAPDGNAVAAVMSFYFKDQVLPYYGGSVPAARDLKANDFMYWELMRHAWRKGVRVFDFGRSKTGTGPFSFKKNWGFEPVALAYQYRLINAAEMPQVNPANPKYRYFIEVWKRLPVPIANVVGPLLSRHLG